MLDNALEIFWLYSCLDRPCVTYNELQEYPDEVREMLLDLGFLQEGPPSHSIMCDWCGEDAGEVQMIERVDGTRVFTAYCPECGLLRVEPDQMRQWYPHYEAVAKWLGLQMGCRGDLETVLPQKLWTVGRAAIAGQSRPVWLVRQLTSEMVEHLPQGKQPILFVIAPMYHQNQYFDPDRTFEMNQIAHLEEGVLRLDVESVHAQLDSVVQSAEPPKKPIKRRSRRAGTIDALKKVIREEILSRKSMLIQKWDEHLPPPEQKYLAGLIGVSPTAVSRALGDGDRELEVLWQIVNDPCQIIQYNS